MREALRNKLPEGVAADFAGNRAVGLVELSARGSGSRTRRRIVREEGSLRVRFPNPENGALSAVLINTAGGIAGGDRFAVGLTAEADSSLAVTSAAAEKIYRTHGPEAEIKLRLKAEDGAKLIWLPQETILFDGAALSRHIDIELAATATLLCAELIVFGRTAMQEKLETGSYIDRWRLRQGGKLVYAETVRLEGEVAKKLDRAATGKGAVALATVLLVPGDEALVERLREAAQHFASECGISAWGGFALARFCGPNAAQLRADVIALLKTIDPAALPRLWLN